MATCTITVGASGQKCGEPAVASFTGRDGHQYHECRHHLWRVEPRTHVAPAPDVPRVPLRQLTPHQREVLERLTRRTRTYPVDVRDFGSRSALDKLVAKGWATVEVDRGPRGGEIRRYRAR